MPLLASVRGPSRVNPVPSGCAPPLHTALAGTSPSGSSTTVGLAIGSHAVRKSPRAVERTSRLKRLYRCGRGGKAMKLVILAGGFGRRLSEETVLRPKPMVEIGGKPIL
jgi:hypothetical protein